MTELRPEGQRVTVVAEERPVVRRTLYPARVTLPDGSEVRLAKLVVTQARVYVFTGGPRGVVEAFQAPYDDADLPPSTAPRSDLYRIRGDFGELVARRLPGCGCSAGQLKHYRPFDQPDRISG